MRAFARLLDDLVFMPSRNGKLALIEDYLKRVPDPHRGWGLSALTGDLSFHAAKPAMIRTLVEERTDPELFRLSYDYVGDMAETCALMWPGDGHGEAPPRLGEIVETLNRTGRSEVAGVLRGWLDRMNATERWALIKLVTGGMRVGVSARLAKTAFARAFGRDLDTVEELWHALDPPFGELFAWAEGRAEKPDVANAPVMRPFMLAHPLEEGEVLDPSDFLAEWKWDGVRVQLVRRGAERRVYSRTGDDISAAFPDIIGAYDFGGIVDGELLVRAEDGGVAPFNHLQQRLNRKTVSAKMMARYPAFVRLYDILVAGEEDLRGLPLIERRRRLEEVAAGMDPMRFDLSEILAPGSWEEIAEMRRRAREAELEGLMLKRRDSAYQGGRVKGLWFKWKRDPLTADVVLMYAQRGHGKRSSFYSDYTFGAWRDGELVPVGKAYFGFTDAELAELDRWVRGHTIQRFGPVREVEKALVLEVAFDSVHRSKRHKSGVAMRFPRIKRIRFDKPANEADHLDAFFRMMGEAEG